MKKKITMMKETFTNDKTGENVEGKTIFVDVVLKQALDKLIQENKDKYVDYITTLQDALMDGINDIIKKESSLRR